MVFSKFKKMSKWGVTASVAVALLGAGSAAYAGFAVGSIGSAKGLKATPSTDVFGNSLDNLILGQLSTEDLDSAGIDYSACGSSPLPAHVLDYLETVLSQDAEDTSNWQSDIDGISDCDYDAAVWQVGEANDGDAAVTVVTASLLDDIVGTDGYTNAILGANSSTDISDVQALFPSALASVTASSVKTMVAETVVGFASQGHANGFNANSDKANYTVTTYEACYDSSESGTGGSNTCTITSSAWTSLQAVINIASDNSSSDLTAANVSDILAMDNTTSASSTLDTSSSLHLDYLTECIDGSSDIVTDLNTCASTFTVPKAKAFQVGQIIAGGDSDYPQSDLTSSLLQDVGVGSSSKAVIDGNYCGSGGNSSCWTLLKASLISSDLTASSSVSDVTSKVNDLMKAQMETVANAATAPGGAVATGCSVDVNLATPHICSHSQWTCTKTSGPSDWVMNGSGTQLTVPAATTATGSQTVNYRLSLGIYTPAYTKDVSKVYDVSAAVAGATNGVKLYNNGSSWNLDNARTQCINRGGRLATKTELQTVHTLGKAFMHNLAANNNAFTYTSACNSGSQNKCTNGNTCGSTNSSFSSNTRVRKKNGWWCNGWQTGSTIYYACADLPTCD